MAAPKSIGAIELSSIGVGDRKCHVTVSVGLAQARDGEDLSALMHRADQALYAAKQRGRNRVVSAMELHAADAGS